MHHLPALGYKSKVTQSAYPVSWFLHNQEEQRPVSVPENCPVHTASPVPDLF